jgi:hypothetical protein
MRSVLMCTFFGEPPVKGLNEKSLLLKIPVRMFPLLRVCASGSPTNSGAGQ